MKLPLRVELNIDPLDLKEILHVEDVGTLPKKITGVALDTRALQKGDLFFALRAARDGHDFVQQAFERGAAAAIVDHKVCEGHSEFVVPDTTVALNDLASWKRRQWNKSIVAISGSNGKTTTKEMTSAILAVDRPTLKAPGTWNNYLGVPLTLLMLQPNHECAVLEMGMNDYGELKKLGSVARHDVAILTNVGPAHFEKFGSLEGIAKAKGELFESLHSAGTAVVNVDDHHIRKLAEKLHCKKVSISMSGPADVSGRVIRDLGNEGYVLQVHYGSTPLELKTTFMGVHNVYNLLCALGAALTLKVPAQKLQQGIDAIVRPEMRLEILELPNGIRIINDCYNANPASMTVALEIAKTIGGMRVIAVLGDMMELGGFAPRAHRDIGIRVASLHYSKLFLMGQFAGDYAQGAIQGGLKQDQISIGKTHKEVASSVSNIVQPGDTILIKGSRGMKLEEVTNGLRQALEGGS